MLTQAEIKEIKVAKVRCLDESLFFTRYFFKHRYNRKFVVNTHHEIICSALDRVLSGKLNRLIINVAPRYSKTELAVKNLIALGLALNPTSKFIHLTYSDTLALDNSEDARDLVMSAEYQTMFPNVKIEPNSKAKNKWYTTVGGGVYAAAAGGQVTGFGAGNVDDAEEIIEFLSEFEEKQQFGGAIIIDDPIKPDDANYDNRRDRINERFDSTIRNRVNSRNTPIIIIGQRVHPKDLSGYLLDAEPGEWEVISLPALYFECGEWKALWPFKHTIEELRKLEEVNKIVFETQYQQNPKPREGLLLPIEDLNFADFDQVKQSDYEFQFMPVDPADTGGDFFACPRGCVIESKVYIPDVIFNKFGTDVNVPATVDKAVINKVNAVQVESNGGWVLARKEIKRLIVEKLPDCDVRSINAKGQKETRILERASWIKNHCVFRKDYKDHPEYKAFIDNLTSYTVEGQNKNDDAPDVMAQMGKYFKEHFPHLW